MKKILLGTAALAIALAAAPAYATGNHHNGGGNNNPPQEPEVNSDVVNGQLNLGDVWANLNMDVYDVTGDVSGTAAAIGNSFSAELGGNAEVDNYQKTRANIQSHVDATLDWIEGDVDLTSAAVGNTASIVNEPYAPCGDDPECVPIEDASLTVTNGQEVYVDPHASLDIFANGVGDLNGTSAAISNSLSVEAWNASTTVDSYQRTNAETAASVDAAISHANSVNLTAAAVGNTVSVNTLID